MTYLAMPYGADPVKATGDDDRPALWRGELVRTNDGWEVQATNSYLFVQVPCTEMGSDEPDAPALVAGPISHQGLIAIARTGHFRAHETVEPVHPAGKSAGEFYSRALEHGDKGQWPDVAAFTPTTDERSFEVAVSLALLTDLVAALGHPDPSRAVVLTFESPSTGKNPSLRAFKVRVGWLTGGPVGLLCPVARPKP